MTAAVKPSHNRTHSALKGDYSPDLLSVVSPSIEFSPVDSARLVLLLLLGCWKRKQMQIAINYKNHNHKIYKCIVI